MLSDAATLVWLDGICAVPVAGSGQTVVAHRAMRVAYCFMGVIKRLMSCPARHLHSDNAAVGQHL